MKLNRIKHVGTSLATALCALALLLAMPVAAWAQQTGTVKGSVKSDKGEALMGAVVYVVGTQINAIAEADGTYTLKGVKQGVTIRAQLLGYNAQEVKWNGEGSLIFVLKEKTNTFNEAVVTAMGIVRKEKSLTYATQQIKSDELTKVQDVNLVNSIEGKISGVTITPSAGGAGGSSKILLRGNKSVLGNNAPLIVVDGIPMSNSTRGGISDAAAMGTQAVGEGADPLSQINPDDIESMNILKGANAAALYGSQAANGVVMITTKKGKEGKMAITFNSNVTFDSPLLTPKLQNKYGAQILNGNALQTSSWGDPLSGEKTKYALNVPGDGKKFTENRDIYLRNYAKDDIDDFYKMGWMTNNSISLSGGTKKITTYFSYANSHANGMTENNSYNRNTLAFRQSYKFWDFLDVDVNANYVQTKTRNRVSGGTVMNPIYHMYVTPRNVDMDYYRNNYRYENATWNSEAYSGFVFDPFTGGYVKKTGVVYPLHGVAQNWAYTTARQNNPYWLLNQNTGWKKDDRFYGSAQVRFDIGKVLARAAETDALKGLTFQGRVSLDHTKYNSESYRYATTWLPSSMDDYGRFWIQSDRTNEIYTDYLLSYNRDFNDFSVSATAGWVGHLIKGKYTNVDATATSDRTDGLLWSENLEKPVNQFSPSSVLGGVSFGETSSWDKAALFTAQLGWREMVYVDGSYRRDWYRPFKQFAYRGAPDNYGYFGVGANAILTSIFKESMPKQISYLKYRLSYSEVGNSIPNIYFSSGVSNSILGTTTVSGYNSFYPYPETTKSFETGFESQFFHNTLNFDVTYYNSAMHHMYLNIPATNGKTQPVNTGVIRNQGIEMTLGYNWNIGRGWRWRTTANFSYNHNKIEKTYTDEKGNAKDLATTLAGVQVLYRQGGAYGDMYATDYARWGEDRYGYEETAGNWKYSNTQLEGYTLINKKGDIFIDANGKPTIDGSIKMVDESQNKAGVQYGKFIGNMNSDFQIGWSNTISYKNFNVYFLINGRIGGKVISMTEAELDKLGLSARTGAARDYAIANGIYYGDPENKVYGMYINEGRDLVPIQGYYETIGATDPSSYVYNATNFRLRELSIGYTFRDLFGEGKHLSLSAIGRNLFFIYKDSPVDPDISLASGNGLGAFEYFNLPSARSFGLNLKLNF